MRNLINNPPAYMANTDLESKLIEIANQLQWLEEDLGQTSDTQIPITLG